VAIQDVLVIQTAAAAIARGTFELEWYSIHQQSTEIPRESCQATVLTEWLPFDLKRR